jgi:hypothetical protein
MRLETWCARVFDYLSPGIPANWASSNAGLERLRDLYKEGMPPKRAARRMNDYAWAEEYRRRNAAMDQVASD